MGIFQRLINLCFGVLSCRRRLWRSCWFLLRLFLCFSFLCRLLVILFASIFGFIRCRWCILLVLCWLFISVSRRFLLRFLFRWLSILFRSFFCSSLICLFLGFFLFWCLRWFIVAQARELSKVQTLQASASGQSTGCKVGQLVIRRRRSIYTGDYFKSKLTIRQSQYRREEPPSQRLCKTERALFKIRICVNNFLLFPKAGQLPGVLGFWGFGIIFYGSRALRRLWSLLLLFGSTKSDSRKMAQKCQKSDPIFFKICMSSFHSHMRLSTKFEENRRGEAFSPYI